MVDYLFDGEEELSPISLEQAAGLPRGAINQMVVFAAGAVEIYSDGLTKKQQDDIRKALDKWGLGHGLRTAAY